VAAGEGVAPMVVDLAGTAGLQVAVPVEQRAWLEVTPAVVSLPGRLVMRPSARLRPGAMWH
jgi:hypothetical protein